MHYVIQLLSLIPLNYLRKNGFLREVRESDDHSGSFYIKVIKVFLIA